MNKKFKNFIIIYMALTMILLPLRVFGASSLTINIKTRDDLTEEDLRGRTLGVWKINPNFIDPNMDRTEMAKVLDTFTVEELDKQLVSPSDKWILHPKAEDGYKVRLHNLSSGLYYVRELNNVDRLTFIESAIFSPDETDIINLKWGRRPPTPPPPPPPPPPDIPPGIVELIKVDGDGKLLKGAKFTLHYSSGERVKTKNYSYDPKGDEEIFETDDTGKIVIRNLEPGVYYFKEVEAPFGYKILVENSYFKIFKDESCRIEVRNEKEKGSYNFYKTDDKRISPLKGAEFVITRIVEGKHVRLKDDAGKDLILRSGEDGKFSVSNLDYGTYYIWETKAPEGYTLLDGSLKFEIDGNSFEKVLIIENSKRPPIPKTGDITLIVLVIAGAVMVGLGKYMIKDKN